MVGWAELRQAHITVLTRRDVSDDVHGSVRPPTCQGAHIEAQTSSPRASSYRWSSPDILLIFVAVAYCIAGLVRVPRGMSPTWDEVVYLSQVATGIEPVPFSETRAWGMALIAAPIAVITPSIVVIRTYLTLLSGLGLYLAFRPWLGVARDDRTWASYVAPAAAAGFATLWTTLLFGSMAYPNIWLSFALTAGVGHVCRLLAKPSSRGALIGVCASFTLASLLRPTDALAAGGGVLLAIVLIRGPRGILPIMAVLGGLGLGWAVWIVEAYARFGGPIERLRRVSEIVGSQFQFSLGRHLDTVDGPYIACIPQRICQGGPWEATVWWFALPGVALLGIAASVFAPRASRRHFYVLPALSCATFLVPYMVMSPENSQARFLMPAYALLMVPAAYFIVWAATHTRSPARWAVVIVVSVALISHVVVQQATLKRALDYNLPTMQKFADRAQILRNRAGVHRPCLLYGPGAIQLSYLTGCAAHYTMAVPNTGDSVISAALADGDRVVVLLAGANTALPAPYARWQRVEARSKRVTLYAAVSP
jgi:hypothetical protein